ncbi:UDP-galactose transporter-related protein 1 [Entamoeba marina]
MPNDIKDNPKGISKNLNILLTSISLVVSFLSVGFFAEYLTRETFTVQNIKFRNTSVLVLFQSTFSALCAYIAIKVYKITPPAIIPNKRFIVLSTTYCGAMFFSNQALLYIDYPTQIIMKFCKPITVMLFTIFVSKQYKPRQILFSIVTFTGISMFMFDKFTSLDTTKYSDNSFLFGILLIFISLISDGVASSQEDIISHKYSIHTLYVMFYSNLYAIPLFIIISILNGDLFQVFHLMSGDVFFCFIIISYTLCSVLGQYLIYRLISLANALLLVAVTNTRKIITMVISVVVFGHSISSLQVASVVIVFGSLFCDIMTR